MRVSFFALQRSKTCRFLLSIRRRSGISDAPYTGVVAKTRPRRSAVWRNHPPGDTTLHQDCGKIEIHLVESTTLLNSIKPVKFVTKAE